MSGDLDKSALVPKLRFPAFRGAEGWSRKRLKDACEVNPSSSMLPEMFVYIDLESVEAGKLTARKVIARDDAPSRAQRLLHPYDVIFQIVRPYQRNNFHFKASDGLEYVASTGYAQLRAKDSTDFLYQAVHVDGFVDRVIAKCTGSSYPAINSSDLAEVPLALPKPDEQQKIADCLSSLDELIAAQARKVDALKTHKKGLMQQLFPREGETQPRLRFLEFGEQWIKTKLEDLCSSVSSGRDQIDSDGAFDLYGSTSVIGKTKKASFACERILVARVGANAGMLTKAKGVFGVTDNTLVVSPNPSINIDFLFHYLGNININKLIFGSGQPLITGSIIKNLPILVPGDAEQLRVATCIGSLDELIATQDFELEACKAHKIGLIQQLFPATPEGEA